MDSIEDKLSCLKTVEMFEGAKDLILIELATVAKFMEFPQGEELITQGKKCPTIYILTKGEFGIYHRDGDANRLVATLSTPGKVVGEIGAVSGLPATATVSVSSETAGFLKLDGDDFHRIVTVEPELATTVLRSLARYLKS